MSIRASCGRWNYALSKAVVVDLSEDELAKVGGRLWFLWAFSLTTGLSIVAVWLARLRLSLQAHQRAHTVP